MQQQMGQPQFQVIQPNFGPGPGQYATFQQVSYNAQGQLVLQPAAQFLQPGQSGQPGQQIIPTSQLPQQKPGQQPMISGGPWPQGKPMPGQPPQQPQYMITSNGQLQMPPGQPQLLPGNIMLAPQGMPGGMQVSMAGPPGQAPMMKASDGKPVPPGQQQMQGQPQLIAMPGGGMAYMHAGPQQFMQNGQIIFRAPGSDGQQQLMFSPSGPGAPPTGPPQVPNHPQGPPQQIGMPGPPQQQRPSMPQPPPGKTAISRAIAPLLNTSSQSQPRMGYNGNMPNQPSPKSKQKMSPRGGNGMGPGRPPGPKLQAPQMNQQLAWLHHHHPHHHHPHHHHHLHHHHHYHHHLHHQQQQQHQQISPPSSLVFIIIIIIIIILIIIIIIILIIIIIIIMITPQIPHMTDSPNWGIGLMGNVPRHIPQFT